MKKILIFAAATLLMASCCNCKRSSKNAVPLTGTTWELVQLGSTAVNEAGKYRIIFGEDGMVSGTGFCNRITGSYTSKAEGKLDFAPLAATRMMCLGENSEDAYFAALNGIGSYSIDGSRLYLFADGELRAVFEAK